MPDYIKKIVGRKYHEGETTTTSSIDNMKNNLDKMFSKNGVNYTKALVKSRFKDITNTTDGWWENIYGKDAKPVVAKKERSLEDISYNSPGNPMNNVKTVSKVNTPVARIKTAREVVANKQAPTYTSLNPPSVARLNSKQIGVNTDATSIPNKLNTIPTTPMTPSTLTADRSVTKVKYTPSTKPGYENMKEYGTYSKNGDEIDVPNSAVQSKYKNGTKSMNMKDMYAKGSKSIKTKKMTAERFEDSPEDKKADAAAMAKMNKSGKYAAGTNAVKVKPTGPFSGEEIDDAAKATIADKDLESRLDVAAKEDRTAVPTPSLNPNKIADMAKVRQHQEKLNKYGANLKVDGMWGEKTEKASRDLYPQYKEQTRTRQPPVSDARMQGLFGSSGKEPAQAKATGIKTASTATKAASPKYRSAAETSQAWNDLVNKPVTKTNATLSPSQKYAQSDEWKAKSKIRTASQQTAANAEEEEVKKIDEQLALRKQDPGVAEAAANNPVPGMGAFAAHISDSANGGKSISPEYREQLEARREQLRPTPKTAKSKSLDGGDAAIYGAEAVGPAIAKSIKSGGYAGIAKAALRFGPTAADILKTNYDDGFKTPIASTLKATARGAILGTAGSTVLGAGKRVASNIIGAGEESGKLAASMNRAKGAVEASEKAATGAMNKKAYDAAIAAGKTAQDELTGLATKSKPSLGIGKAFGDSFNTTGAGKAVTSVTQNKVISTIKGYRDLNKAKNGVTNAAASGASSGASGAAGTSSKGLTYLEQVAKKEADKVAKATAVAEAEAIKAKANLDRGIKTKATQAKNGVYDDAVKENKEFNKAAKKTANGIKTKRTEELKALADKQLETAETARGAKAAATKQAELDKINEGKYGYKGGRTEPYQPAPASAESDRVARRIEANVAAGEAKETAARKIVYKAKADGTRAKGKVYPEAVKANKAFDIKTRKSIKTISAKRKAQTKKNSIKKQVEKISDNQNKMFDYQ